MDKEPKFLDDETLFADLDETKANRVLNWLIMVFKKAPQDIGHAIYLAREINKFYGDQIDEDKEEHLYQIENDCSGTFCASEIHDSDIFERIMSQLEEKYDI
jgi:hypothetical protein